MSLRMKSLCAIAMLAQCAATMTCDAAEGQTKLRVADALPAHHFFVEQAAQFWMKEVSRLTNDAVSFEYYPGEQLGKAKDLLSLTQTGVADIGYVVPSYVSDKMPLSAVAELPGLFRTSCEGTMAYWKMAQGDGALARLEYQPNGVRVLFAVVMPPYQIFMQKPIENIKSFEGQKLRTTSGAQDEIVKRLKAVPVHITAPDLYDSLSRGTVDGMVFPTASVVSYDVAHLVKFGTTDQNFGSAVLTYMISNARWKSLSPEIQAAMTRAGEETTRRICAYTDGEVGSDLAKIRAKGTTLGPLSPDDVREVAALTSGLAADWASQLDRRGRRGSEILKNFQDALK